MLHCVTVPSKHLRYSSLLVDCVPGQPWAGLLGGRAHDPSPARSCHSCSEEPGQQVISWLAWLIRTALAPLKICSPAYGLSPDALRPCKVEGARARRQA